MRRGGEEQEAVPCQGGCDITRQGSAVDWLDFCSMMLLCPQWMSSSTSQ